MKHYDDIIHLPHPISKKHRQMPIADRAAQFMPFAALTGYEAALAETARLTSPRIEQDDTQRELLNRQLSFLQTLAAETACMTRPAAAYDSEPPHAAQADAQLQITVTYFCPDTKKEGGAYLTASGQFLKVDTIAQQLYLETDDAFSPDLSDGKAYLQSHARLVIPLADILRISGDRLAALHSLSI